MDPCITTDCVFDTSDIVNASITSLTHNINPCKYYETSNFSISSNSNSVSIIHINIRSLQKNFDSLHEFLCSLPTRPKIICLSESRINHKPFINIELPDYKFVHIDSPTSAGGVAVYISSELRFNIFFNLRLDIDGCENIWLKLCHSDLLLGVIYRHPRSNVKLFTNQLNKTLEQLKTFKVYLIGDMNINLSPIFDVSNNNSNVNSADEYVNMLASNGIFLLLLFLRVLLLYLLQ